MNRRSQRKQPRKTIKRRRTIMTLHRRDFIKAGAALSVMSALPRGAHGASRPSIRSRRAGAISRSSPGSKSPSPKARCRHGFRCRRSTRRTGSAPATASGPPTAMPQLKRDAKYGAGFVHVRMGRKPEGAGGRNHQQRRGAGSLRRSRQARQGRGLVRRRSQALYRRDRADPDRRHRQDDLRQDRRQAGVRPRKGAEDLRLGGREHFPQCQDARLRHRRHRRDADQPAI